MSRRIRKPLLTGFVMGLFWATAWGQSDPAKLIQQIEAQRKQIAQMKLEGLVITEVHFEGMTKRWERAFSLAFKRPNFFRLEVKDDFSPKLLVSDGEWVWQFLERNGTYMKRPAATYPRWFDTWVGIFIPEQFAESTTLHPPEPGLLGEVTQTGQEELELQPGQHVLCYVFEAQMKRKHPMYEQARLKIWIGIDDALPRKIEGTFIPQPTRRESLARATILVRSIELEPRLSESLFVFVPPANAKPIR